ncbi:SDR family NAD(P)-dependent oxidoreductase [Oscillatoria amoena NRMC-F 0135]|nr:SDR family oxidoreductase [Desertifilum sp.]MDI9640823.1 SDR family NAD(P)-dependent oxidoreductase [Geitlerinema splendidum]MDL5051690.1 SDR family NAD(P)-dependent oxidoreductase [Oscillatoria amoena NRMC-F 0135]
MRQPLHEKVAIVTGGTGGIGQATCRALVAAGANAVIVDRCLDRIEALQAELPGAETLGLALDVTQESDMEAMAAKTLERFGQIDFLITCAGILRAPGTSPKPLLQVSEAEWDCVLDINLKGVFLSNRAVLPAMIQRRSGMIINLSSTSGRQGKAHDAPYCASKFGVIGLSESLAEEVRLHGIKVQAILPDAVDTPLWEQNGPIKPEYALPATQVADLIVYMLTLPTDTMLVAPVIAPFRTRKRRTQAKAD